MMTRVFSKALNQYLHFRHRDTMRMRANTHGTYQFPNSDEKNRILLKLTLPLDCTGNMTVQNPMDLNDQLGDCGFAMMDKANRIWRWRQGKGVQMPSDATFLSRLKAQYIQTSGGDNGVDEDMLVGPRGVWKSPGIAGDPAAVVWDSLDIDVTNFPLAYDAIDNFYTIQMAWSVPDAFINGFANGGTWDNAGVPDPNNGHYTPITDIDANGRVRDLTWGAWAWFGPNFIRSIQPQCFIAFSPQQFDIATGLDSKGRHIRTQAALWKSRGGSAISEQRLALFPPLSGPVNPPDPPNPSPVPGDDLEFTLHFNTEVKPGNPFIYKPKIDIPAGSTLYVYKTPKKAALEEALLAVEAT